MYLESMTTDGILSLITQNQNIQKKNPSDSSEWQAASKRLASLFAEMARRQSQQGPAGEQPRGHS